MRSSQRVSTLAAYSEFLSRPRFLHATEPKEKLVNVPSVPTFPVLTFPRKKSAARTSGAEAQNQNRRLIAAVNRCATQNQIQHWLSQRRTAGFVAGLGSQNPRPVSAKNADTRTGQPSGVRDEGKGGSAPNFPQRAAGKALSGEWKPVVQPETKC